MTTEIVYRFKFAVPSQGIPIYSEADFDEPQDGIDAMKRAFSEGQLSDWEMWKITRTVEEELITEEHR